jgi:ATP-dependent Zn protease
MVSEFGMGDTLGLLVAGEAKPTETLENEMKELLESEYERAKKLLRTHRATLDQVAGELLEHETLERPEFLELMAEALAAEAAV